MEEYGVIKVNTLNEFTVGVLVHLGVPREDAETVARVLITADQMGDRFSWLAEIEAIYKWASDGSHETGC